MTTRTRTWMLLAGLSALFVTVGGLVGGAGGILVFLVIAIAFNFAMFWFSDRIALKMSKCASARAGRSARARRRRRGHLGPCPDPRSPPVPDPVPAAECVRHGPEPAALRRRGHRRPHRADAARAGSGRARPRARAHPQPRRPRDDDRRDDRGGNRRDRELPPVPVAVRRRRRREPARRDRLDRGDPRRAGRGDDAPVRDLPAARVPRRRDGRGAARRGPAAGGRPRVAPARGTGAADAGEPGHGVALHREPALRERRRVALLDAPADPRADRASPGAGRRARPPADGEDNGRRRRRRRRWPRRRRRCTAGSTWRSPGRRPTCPSASGRSTSIVSTRTSASSCRSSSRRSSSATSCPEVMSSTRSPAPGRRSSSRSSRAATRPARTSLGSTAC